jgi:CRP-like cAMP-binding protein
MMILVQDGVDPTTEIECLFAIFFGMFGMVVGAVLVGQTADIIGNLHRSETRYRNKLDDVTEQLRNLEISGQTRRRVFEYLDFIWTVNKGLNRERILGELSDNLKCEVLVAVHGEVIKKIPFFDIDQIPELLVHVVQLLKSSYYLPGDVIVHEHEKTVDTSCMYFIVYGNVAAYHMREPNKILHLMSKGDFFGEIAYLARGARRTASICAASNSDVASLMFSDVDRLIHLFPEMKTRMESELKKHMAYTEEGRKYIKAATRMEKVQVGSILMHETRGEGIVIKIDNHKRRHVQYKNGDIHKYLPTSWHKIKLIKEGKGTLNENIWDMREPGIKEESSREGTTPVSSNAGEGGSAGPEKDMSGKVMSFAKKMLKKRRDRSKKWSKPSPFKAQKSNSSHTR